MVDEGCRYISKLSSARGSLCGAKPEETTCTTRIPWSYAYGEITTLALDYRVNLSLWVTLHYMVNAREKRKCLC